MTWILRWALPALVACGAFATQSQLCIGESPPADAAPKPAEQRRLSTKVFREALKRRGLTELLELHLKDFPPPGITERRLMQRDIKLAVFADLIRPTEERVAAVTEANGILAKLIEDNPDDLRRYKWQFTLAHSLLYDQAEPFFTNFLYRGGSTLDRTNLHALAARAVNILDSLGDQLGAEYDQIDGLSIREFEKLEKSGYVERIDQLAPKAEYLLAWGRFYDSLALNETDPTRARLLNDVVDYFATNKAVIETPHAVSLVQVQAQLLAGMVQRRLNDHGKARQYFDRALRTADRIADPQEGKRILWAVTLASVERIRNDRDAGRFEDALSALSRFRENLARMDDENFGLQIVSALLERSVFRARADAVEKTGRFVDAERYRNEAVAPLVKLMQRRPERRDEVYATIYEMIGPDANPARLDPIEQCSLLAGLLLDAAQEGPTSDVLLDRAVRVGEYFLANVTAGAKPLVPQVLYNMAVAEYRRGRIAAAAKRFLEVARDHSTFDSAQDAGKYAVQLAADMYADPSLHDHPDLQRLYRDALEAVVANYTGTPASMYWRFYLAQLLDERGESGEAAAQYALVHTGHEHYLESTFLRVRCLANALKAQAEDDAVDASTIGRKVDEFLATQRDFVSSMGGRVAVDPGAPRASAFRGWVAGAKVLGAEMLVLPRVNRPALALKTISELVIAAGTEGAAFAGRVWRVRLLALETLGRLDEAMNAIPAFIAADPEGAGPTMQSLCAAMAAEAERLQIAGDDRAAQRKAEMALVLAQQVFDWSRERDHASHYGETRALTIQLAEANLRAARYSAARDLFEPLVVTGANAPVLKEANDLRVLYGYAESLFQLEVWSGALAEFNKLARGLPPSEFMRWKSLLRDLQCRTNLKHPPADILKVIEQQKYLFPDLGGAKLASEFEKLERENRRRADRN